MCQVGLAGVLPLALVLLASACQGETASNPGDSPQDVLDAIDAGQDIGTAAETTPATGRYPGPCDETLDLLADGTLLLHVTNTFDEHQRKVTALYLSSALPVLFTYAYDSAGKLVTEESDEGRDGSIERRTTYAYDEEARLVLSEAVEVASGTVTRRTTYTYDAQGRLAVEDEDSDGLVADGTVDQHWIYTYDALGVLTHKASASWRIVYTLDLQGNVRVEDTFKEPSGTATSRTTYAYDTWGNLLREDVDIGTRSCAACVPEGPFDGVPEQFTTYGYDCWQ